MTWTEVFRAISATLASVGSAGIIFFALSSWLGRVWASRILEKERSQYAKDLAEHTADLDKLKKEHEVIFTNLHEKRATVIEELYSRLVETDDAFHSIIKPFQDDSEPSLKNKFSTFVKAYNEYYYFFQKKRVYFSPSVCKIIDQLNMVLVESHTEIAWNSPDEFHPVLMKEKRERWIKVWDLYNNNMVNLKKELENSFRSILGVET